MEGIQIKSQLIEQLIEISIEAGKAVLEVYNTNFDYKLKQDLSPLTKADTISHNIICERLKILTPDIPILSEENSDIPFAIRSLWKEYWLVDPLDGTKEFINRNGEFTINIALIKNNKPIFGLINIPVKDQTYWGTKELGSFVIKGKQKPIKINTTTEDKNKIRILTSRSHNSIENRILEKLESYELIKAGSSLKFCLIANGKADAYIRLGPTSEWDTAAGDAIVTFAGGTIISLERTPLTYNLKKSYLNPHFIVSKSHHLTKSLLNIFDNDFFQ